VLVSTAEQVARVIVYECELLVISNECVLINMESLFSVQCALERVKIFRVIREHMVKIHGAENGLLSALKGFFIPLGKFFTATSYFVTAASIDIQHRID
jgi:hypothetical protein